MAHSKRMGANRAALERMHRIHQLVANREYPNTPQLAAEFEVTTRTLKRDVEFMRDRMGLPIEFDPRRKGYCYTQPVEAFPQLPMTEAEAFALFLASKAIEQYRGTPFQRLLETAFRRLTGRLDQHVKYSMVDLDGAISFRPLAPAEADVQAFEILTRAVREHREVTFLYRNHGVLTFQKRRVHSYHLAHVDGRWCLFGFDAVRNAMRTFVLCRLQKPRLLKGRFVLPKKFDLNEYLRGSFSLFRGRDGDDYEVVIDFDPWAADEIRGRRWHATQSLTELARGYLRLRMRLNNLEEVERWVLSFGPHATVVRPKALIQRFRQTADHLARVYRENAAEGISREP